MFGLSSVSVGGELNVTVAVVRDSQDGSWILNIPSCGHDIRGTKSVLLAEYSEIIGTNIPFRTVKKVHLN